MLLSIILASLTLTKAISAMDFFDSGWTKIKSGLALTAV
jgi:hypothetical protein